VDISKSGGCALGSKLKILNGDGLLANKTTLSRRKRSKECISGFTCCYFVTGRKITITKGGNRGKISVDGVLDLVISVCLGALTT
jgi:hypothetical protein